MRRAVALTSSRYHLQPTSRTFHGRDIFAPAAAQLVRGVPLEDLGEAVAELHTIGLPQPVVDKNGIDAHILHVDHFGNLVTDLTYAGLCAWQQDGHEHLSITAGDVRIYEISGTFSDVAPGRPVAYFGGSTRLEIAVRQGNAAAKFNLGIGATVRVERR